MADSTCRPQTVFIQIDRPKDGRPGRVCEGMFIVADGVVTLTDRDGNPVKDQGGKTYTQELRDGVNPKTIAGRLTRELREALRGKNAPHNNFERAIEYPQKRYV